jgi:hypothetical protein
MIGAAQMVTAINTRSHPDDMGHLKWDGTVPATWDPFSHGQRAQRPQSRDHTQRTSPGRFGGGDPPSADGCPAGAQDADCLQPARL